MFFDFEETYRPEQPEFFKWNPHINAVSRVDDTTENKHDEVEPNDRNSETSSVYPRVTGNEGSTWRRLPEEQRRSLMRHCTQKCYRRQTVEYQ